MSGRYQGQQQYMFSLFKAGHSVRYVAQLCGISYNHASNTRAAMRLPPYSKATDPVIGILRARPDGKAEYRAGGIRLSAGAGTRPANCRYPLWGIDETSGEYCGAPTANGGPYCAAHHAVCYYRPCKAAKT